MKLQNLSVAELADRWRIHEQTLKRWRLQNKGPGHIRVGKKIIYPIEFVEQWEDKRLVDAGVPSKKKIATQKRPRS